MNSNGINPHRNFVELTYTMGILDDMGAEVYIVNETNWDTPCPTFCKYIKHIIKNKDKYAVVIFTSNMED